LVQPSAIGELADQLDAGGRVSRFPREKRAGRSENAMRIPDIQRDPSVACPAHAAVRL